MPEVTAPSPAELASEEALTRVWGSIRNAKSFVLEAGAGAGKTYSLVKVLRFLIDEQGRRLRSQNQKIACITFTNVAKDEIEARTDRNPILYCDTIHGFCWSLISGFQKYLRATLPEIGRWQERLQDVGEVGTRKVHYSLGHPTVTEELISLHHQDVLSLTIRLMGEAKFQNLMRSRYPIVLIDEYQDTDAKWIECIKMHFLGCERSPLFGFFGDHWQKIYGNGCGQIVDPSLEVIGKQSNFRSVSTIVDCLNKMRPDLPQFVADPTAVGEVRVFHTNNWIGDRRTGAHQAGDLPADAAGLALDAVKEYLVRSGWRFDPPQTKILMLTHRVLADQQGYGSIPEVFEYNESFTQKEQPHVAFFVDRLEPACNAFAGHRYGEMFAAIGNKVPHMFQMSDKTRWACSMERLMELRKNGTVGEVITHLRASRLPPLPEAVEGLERELERCVREEQGEMGRSLIEVQRLHEIRYQEIVNLANYLNGHSPFETKHGVKGAEFENVLVVVGRGWSKYNFNQMLERAADESSIPAAKRSSFEENRNLFYVCCSRPKKRLALLFTQALSDSAIGTLQRWFGASNIEALDL